MSRRPTNLLGVLRPIRLTRLLITDGVAARLNISRVRIGREMPYELAVVLAYGFGTLSCCLRARWFPFAVFGRTITSEMPPLAFVIAVAFTPVWIVIAWLARVIFVAPRFTWHRAGVAHPMGVALSTSLDHRHHAFVAMMP